MAFNFPASMGGSHLCITLDGVVLDHTQANHLLVTGGGPAKGLWEVSYIPLYSAMDWMPLPGQVGFVSRVARILQPYAAGTAFSIPAWVWWAMDQGAHNDPKGCRIKAIEVLARQFMALPHDVREDLRVAAMVGGGGACVALARQVFPQNRKRRAR